MIKSFADFQSALEATNESHSAAHTSDEEEDTYNDDFESSSVTNRSQQSKTTSNSSTTKSRASTKSTLSTRSLSSKSSQSSSGNSSRSTASSTKDKQLSLSTDRKSTNSSLSSRSSDNKRSSVKSTDKQSFPTAVKGDSRNGSSRSSSDTTLKSHKSRGVESTAVSVASSTSDLSVSTVTDEEERYERPQLSPSDNTTQKNEINGLPRPFPGPVEQVFTIDEFYRNSLQKLPVPQTTLERQRVITISGNQPIISSALSKVRRVSNDQIRQYMNLADLNRAKAAPVAVTPPPQQQPQLVANGELEQFIEQTIEKILQKREKHEVMMMTSIPVKTLQTALDLNDHQQKTKGTHPPTIDTSIPPPPPPPLSPNSISHPAIDTDIFNLIHNDRTVVHSHSHRQRYNSNSSSGNNSSTAAAVPTPSTAPLSAAAAVHDKDYEYARICVDHPQIADYCEGHFQKFMSSLIGLCRELGNDCKNHEEFAAHKSLIDAVHKSFHSTNQVIQIRQNMVKAAYFSRYDQSQQQQQQEGPSSI